jgi:CRP-like cAMP-binding protein
MSALVELEGPSRDALLAMGKVEKLPRRYRLTQQNEPARYLAFLGAGRVKLERVGIDHTFPLGHRGPGDIVGETALATGAAQENAVVQDAVEALLVPLPALRERLASDRSLQVAFANALVLLRQSTEDRLASLLQGDVELRLAEFLLAALDRWGDEHENGQVVTAPFTHADIATVIGSTRETVTLQLGKMRRAGLVDFDRRRIVIRDRDALARRVAAS